MSFHNIMEGTKHNNSNNIKLTICYSEILRFSQNFANLPKPLFSGVRIRGIAFRKQNLVVAVFYYSFKKTMVVTFYCEFFSFFFF